MDPLPFQSAAATQIADRFANYSENPLLVDRTTTIPFFQTLAAITGSGKTLMLADTVTQMRARLALQPIVLWLSRGKVVVWQTYANLSSGKYADNVPGFTIKPLLELAPSDVEDERTPLLLIATAAKFARRDETTGDRRIFALQLDLADASLWNLLKRRRLPSGQRRPLIVVYDEGHNLSDLQSTKLLDLAPDALIAASATMELPATMGRIVSRLRADRGWGEGEFGTTVSSAEVVVSGLVKERLLIAGYVTPMETAIDALLGEMRIAQEAAQKLDDPFTPKAIYVCTTNAVDGVPITEDAKRPFQDRLARPILIWRHLVENAGIDPADIAVYLQLTFNKEAPADPRMRLFTGADGDYERFIAGGFRHVIFNLSLQEGWDDPTCGFAYIDKDMASTRAITQVVGRVLRQPGGKHHTDPILNTAHFYIRNDERGVFDAILKDINRQLGAEHPAIKLVVRKEGTSSDRFRLEPSRPRAVPTTSIYSPRQAVEAITRVTDGLMDFRQGGPMTIGQGARMQVLQEVGNADDPTYEWVEVEHSNRVTARSIFRRELQRLYPGALRRPGGPVNLVDIEHPKFDALVEINSQAAQHVRQIAERTVDAYVEHSRVLQNDDDPPYSVGAIAVDPASAETFSNALHEQYSGLNDFELRIARALDRTQRVWARNPGQSGYFIPLLDRGPTTTFWPDFLVWVDRTVVAIDTKGKHLLSEDARRKLFDIEGTGDRARITLRLISEGEGHISPSGQIVQRANAGGYTVWRWSNGRLSPIGCANERAAIEAALSL